jgi:hypothetical protein
MGIADEEADEEAEEGADTIIEAVTVDDAVVQACQQTHESEESKRKTLFILDSLQLSPLVVTDALGMEQNALAHPSVISKLSSGSISVPPIIPTKRKSDGVIMPKLLPTCRT